MIRQDFEDAEFGDVDPVKPARRRGSRIGNAFELLFRATVNSLYLLLNILVLAIAVGASREGAGWGVGDYLLFVVLPIMLIAWFFDAIISLLGWLGYEKAETKYGMIRLVSRISTGIVLAATVVVAILWVLDRMSGREDHQ
jgi:hypothetical protein